MGFAAFLVGLSLVGTLVLRPRSRARDVAPTAPDNGTAAASDPGLDREVANEARALASVLDGILDRVESALRAGMTTRAIDALVKQEIAAAGVKPTFLGYHGYPAHCTTSINDEVMNTIPPQRALRSGDLLKLQVGIAGRRTFAIRGWTYAIGVTTDEDQRLLTVGRAALERAVAVAVEQANARTGDLGHAIQSTAEDAGYTVNRAFVGYRIGTVPVPHGDPAIPCHGQAGRGPRLKPDWVLALFAVVHAGAPEGTVSADGWNTVDNDGRRSVLFNRMVVVRPSGSELLTRPRS
jgi:methionyl aminopeptidase